MTCCYGLASFVVYGPLGEGGGERGGLIFHVCIILMTCTCYCIKGS